MVFLIPDHIKKLYNKLDKLESIVSELADKCGYAVVVEDFDTDYISPIISTD